MIHPNKHTEHLNSEHGQGIACLSQTDRMSISDIRHCMSQDADAPNITCLLLCRIPQNGVLLRTVLDQVTGDLSDTRTRYLGSRPVKLFRVRMQNNEAVSWPECSVLCCRSVCRLCTVPATVPADRQTILLDHWAGTNNHRAEMLARRSRLTSTLL